MHDILILFLENPTLLYVVVGLVGLCVGSFLNVVILRTPKMMEQEWKVECQSLLHPDQPIIDHEKLTLNHPASTCPQCHMGIRWFHNIPLISWLVLRGKCASCKHPISIRYPFIEVLTAVTSITIAIVFGASVQMLFGLVFTWILITLTFIDFDTQLLPDRFTFSLIGLGLAANSYSIFTTPTTAIWGTLIGFLCLWVVYILYKLITGKEGMGYGDFKLLAALGAWMGPMMLPLIILLSSVVGVIIGLVVIKVKKNQAFAFGPYIAIAGWIAFIWGSKIMAIYLGQ